MIPNYRREVMCRNNQLRKMALGIHQLGIPNKLMMSPALLISP